MPINSEIPQVHPLPTHSHVQLRDDGGVAAPTGAAGHVHLPGATGCTGCAASVKVWGGAASGRGAGAAARPPPAPACLLLLEPVVVVSPLARVRQGVHSLKGGTGGRIGGHRGGIV